MVYFLCIFLLLSGLILCLDAYFYKTILMVLDYLDLNSSQILESLGFYNQSIFPSRLYIIFLSLFLTSLIYLVFSLEKARLFKKQRESLELLEADLSRINGGDYSLELKTEGAYSLLRDEIYKIVVNLKSIEEEEKRQKRTLKKDLSNITHQIKTPITSINFMLELLEEDKENKDLYLEKIGEETDRLYNFTEVLLKLSQLNSKTIEYKFTEIYILEMLESLVSKLNKNNRVRVDFSGEDFKLLGDEIWLYEALLNIIKNSLEHSKDCVQIDLVSNPIYKMIRISDNGAGLSEKNLERIFERFFRTGNKESGYGIGLNMAQKIIKIHKGEIRAYNDQGLTFEIKFYNVT